MPFAKNTVPPPASIARMTAGIARRRAKSNRQFSWRGARKALSTAGMPRVRSRCGATGPMTPADIRLRAGIFSRKPPPNKPRKLYDGFLRNSRIGVARNGLQYEAERLGPPLKVGEDAVAILLLIVVGARIPVTHAMPEGVVK